MTSPGGSSFERFAWSLLALVIALVLLAGVLSRLLVPVIVLALVVAGLRLVMFYTRM
jgi:hypothetical protein